MDDDWGYHFSIETAMLCFKTIGNSHETTIKKPRLQERMPLVAERLLLDGLAKLDSLPGWGC